MANPLDTIPLSGRCLSLQEAKRIAAGAPISIDPSCQEGINEGRRFVQELASSSDPIYGLTTGFGFFANKKIAAKDLLELQANIIRSHASGYGEPLSCQETRLAMALRLNVLLKGLAGVRLTLCEQLCQLINAQIYPIIPAYGSVGASGDLAPLAHLALALIGEGRVSYKGNIIAAKEALDAAGMSPITLVEKEGLSLINGTQVMGAIGSLALAEMEEILDKADHIAALSLEAFSGSVDALHPLIHSSRGHSGQITSAQKMLTHLQGSYVLSPEYRPRHVQAPYSLRCAPQVHGPSREAFSFAAGIFETELGAATDNPLVFPSIGKILSGGNFHGEYLAMACDVATMALSEIASISERRLELHLNPHMSGLSGFLAGQEGLHSGYMATQYLAGHLVSENKVLSHPAWTDSIPGNVGIEDHVSMGMTSARKLRQVLKNVTVVLAVEMLAAVQAIDLRGVAPLGKGTQRLYDALRAAVPRLEGDRYAADDVTAAVEVLKTISYETPPSCRHR